MKAKKVSLRKSSVFLATGATLLTLLVFSLWAHRLAATTAPAKQPGITATPKGLDPLPAFNSIQEKAANNLVFPLATLADQPMQQLSSAFTLSQRERYLMINYGVSEVGGDQGSFPQGYRSLIDRKLPLLVTRDLLLHIFNENINELNAVPVNTKLIDLEKLFLTDNLGQVSDISNYGGFLQKKAGYAALQEFNNFANQASVTPDKPEENSGGVTVTAAAIPDTDVYLQPDTLLLGNILKFYRYLQNNLEPLGVNNPALAEKLNRQMQTWENLAAFADKELQGSQLTADEQDELRSYLNRENTLTGTGLQAVAVVYIVSEKQADHYFYGINYRLPQDNPASATVFTINNNNFALDYDFPQAKQNSGTVRIPVLMYHHVAPQPDNLRTRHLFVSPQEFDHQLAYLVGKNYLAITPLQFYNQVKSGKNPDQKMVMLTFDDGNTDNYTYAYPILKKYGLTGVFYVVSARLGISRVRLKEMSDNGMIIDSHTATHILLDKEQNAGILQTEIAGSKYSLQSATGKDVYSIAYPGCVANKTALSITSANYLLGFSCGKYIDHRFRDRFALSRLHVYNNFENFQKRLSGIYEVPVIY